jgi:hypothetical protein
MIVEPHRWGSPVADRRPLPAAVSAPNLPPALPARKNNARVRSVESPVARPKSFVLLLGFAGAVVALFQAGEWLLDVWNLFSHR